VDCLAAGIALAEAVAVGVAASVEAEDPAVVGSGADRCTIRSA